MVGLHVDNRTLGDIELIIFDKDGTLFQLYPFWNRLAHFRARVIQDTLGIDDSVFERDVVRSMGIDDENRRMFPEGPIGIHPRRFIMQVCLDALKRNGYSADMGIVDSSFKEADRLMNRPEELRMAMVPMPGMVDFLRRCDGRCMMAVFSSDTTERLERIAELTGIDEHFDYFLGGDRTEMAKPHPWGARKIMNDIGVSPGNACFIGDATVDMECGSAAGITNLIGIRSDITDVAVIRRFTDVLIDGYGDIDVVDR